MKKTLIVFLAAAFMLLAACSADNGAVKEKTIADYFPLKANVFMDYEGVGNEYAEEKTYVDYLHDNTIQIRSSNPGTTMARVYKIENGELRMVFSQGETYYLADFTAAAASGAPDILLKEPLVKGTEWQSPDGQKRYISDIDLEVETPSGKYQALVVTTEGPESLTRNYYVKDVGLVKKEFVAGDSTVTTSLKTISSDAKGEIPVNFYYPDFDAEKLGYVSKKLTYATNDNLIQAFTEAFQSPPDDSLTKVISPNVKINDMYLDSASGIAYIDFSNNLVSEMNAGSSLEGLVLQSITNTLGGYYQVEKVFIRLDGKAYESGHIMLTEDTWFNTDYENSYQIGS